MRVGIENGPRPYLFLHAPVHIHVCNQGSVLVGLEEASDDDFRFPTKGLPYIFKLSKGNLPARLMVDWRAWVHLTWRIFLDSWPF